MAVTLNLLDLPLELVRLILEHIVSVRGMKRALRLRLVNKFLAEEVLGAMIRTRLIDDYIVGAQRWPMAKPYLEQRMLQEKGAAIPVLGLCQKIAEALALADGDRTRYRHYVSCISSLLLARVHLKGFSSWEKEEDEANVFQRGLVTVAAFTGKLDLVEAYAHLPWEHAKRDYLGDPYTAAVHGGQVEVLKFLLSAACQHNLNIQDCVWRTMLIAARKGDVEMLDCVLQSDWTPVKDRFIHWFRYGTLEAVVERLLYTPSIQFFNRSMAVLEMLPDDQLEDRTVEYLLDSATENGWTEMARHLLSLYPSLRRPFRRQHKCSPRRVTCVVSYDMVEILINHNATETGPDLLCAAARGEAKAVKRFLEHGVDLNSWRNRRAIFVAARKGYLEIVRMLLDHGADVNFVSTLEEYPEAKRLWQCPPSLLGYAVALEHTEMVKLLIERGASLYNGDTAEAFRVAQKDGLDSMVELLLRYYDPDYLGLDMLF